jgi:hypothetical protein
VSAVSTPTLVDAIGLMLLALAALMFGCALVGAAGAALNYLRRASDDQAVGHAPCDCLTCVELDADEQLGILRTDFELWESEWTP